jgi:hypothetical protein
MSIDRATVSAFMRLKAPEVSHVLAWFESVYRKAAEDCAKVADEDQWRRLQGRAQLAKEVLDLVESSPQVLAKLETK